MWTGSGSGQAEVLVEGKTPALERWGERGQLVSVEAAPLSAILANLAINPQEVSLVWTDIQGSETQLIVSAPDVWTHGVPLYLEVDPDSLSLHGGIKLFLDSVREHFGRFLTREDLLVGGRPPRPIDDFPAWLTGIGPNCYSDALLLQ